MIRSKFLDTSHIIQIIIFILCILLSAYFSSAESAFTTVNIINIRNLAEDDNKKAKIILPLIEDHNKLMSTILIGNNLVNILAASLATAFSIDIFGGIAVGITVGIVTLIVLIFGEIMPKALAVKNAEKISLSKANSMRFFVVILSPITFILLKISNILAKVFGNKNEEHKPFVTQEELISLVNMGHEEGVLAEDEKEMLENVFEFKDTPVRAIMTPRPDIISIDSNISYSELKQLFREDFHSRLPVCEESLDKIIGFIHVRDFAIQDFNDENFDLTKIIRKPYFTYELQSVTKLLKSMRQEHIQLAIVLDEYGGTAGLVSIEDLVEEIIGEIEDEHDLMEQDISKLNEQDYLIDGSTNIEDVNDYFDFELPEDDYDSIAGFLYSEFDRVPKENDSINYQNLRFTVKKMIKNRIETIFLHILTDEEIEVLKEKKEAENNKENEIQASSDD